MRAIRLCSLSLLLALSSCTRSPADQLKTELQTVTSWAATARMVGEAWLKGTVPDAYAAHTLRTAQVTLQEEIKSIEEQSPEGAAELHAALASQTRGIGQVVEQMRAAVEKRDGRGVAQLLKQLESEEQSVRALGEGGGARP